MVGGGGGGGGRGGTTRRTALQRRPLAPRRRRPPSAPPPPTAAPPPPPPSGPPWRWRAGSQHAAAAASAGHRSFISSWRPVQEVGGRNILGGLGCQNDLFWEGGPPKITYLTGTPSRKATHKTPLDPLKGTALALGGLVGWLLGPHGQ